MRFSYFYPSRQIPEMICFDSYCQCIYYSFGGHEVASRGNKSFLMEERFRYQSVFSPEASTYTCRSSHHHSIGYDYADGTSGHRITLKTHWPQGQESSVCLVTKYEQDIGICPTTATTTINPSHRWLHAMDVNTYQYGKSRCKNRDCKNYVERLGIQEQDYNRRRRDVRY
jgi:hypothetical protein